MPRSLAAALLLACSVNCCLAAEAAKPAPKRAPPAAPAVEMRESDADFYGRTVFQVLIAEFALQRGQLDIGVGAYADLARRTRDPQVVARATEVALVARQGEVALELARLWTQIEPDSQRARQSASTALVMLNRIEDLAPEIAALLEKDKASLPDHLLRLNRLLGRHADKQAVQRLIDAVAKPYEGIAEAHLAMATAAANAGDHPRALSESARSLELRPDWEAAALLRAQLLARQSQGEATALLRDFVGSNAGAKDARLALARLLIAEKRYDESRGHFDRLLKDFPDNPEIIYPVAMLALQANDPVTGKAQLEKLLSGDFKDKATVRFFLGQIEEEARNLDAALAHYRQVDSGEQHVPARARAAQILAGKGKLEEARQLVRETTGRTPEEKTQLLLAEAHLLREAKRTDDAFALLNAALHKAPDDTDLLYDSALLAERLGKFDILEARLQRLLEIKPDHAHGLNALGYSWADRNVRLGEAYELISKATSLAPNDPFIMDSLGWVLYRQGKSADALKTLERAYGLKADPEIAAHLGEVLWSLGRRDEARSLLLEAVRKNPESEVLAEAVRKFGKP
ncbi:MAG: tetratricopeptide repeat protein [Azonexus sp.]|nr:tetratricopeptide repeat protein [Betaproteobacteria bacterium]MBK8916672.1 tetratricopeptide repeat protein [Betaproteobacteria bacterium]MBP6036507.1 tetratricopeptide repeat protein [Azonexus sp.]MBP6907116.1 tetratricopeptide repeat protein [Azonexus sp.]